MTATQSNMSICFAGRPAVLSVLMCHAWWCCRAPGSVSAANAIIATPHLLQSIALCVGDARILVSERACEIITAIAGTATLSEAPTAIAQAVAHSVGTHD